MWMNQALLKPTILLLLVRDTFYSVLLFVPAKAMESGRTVAASAAPPTFQVHDFSCGPGSDGPKDPPVGERRKSSVCA